MKYLNIFCFIFFLVIIELSCDLRENNKADSKEQLNDLLQKSQNYYLNNEYQVALKYFNKILSLDSCRGDIYFKRGYCKAILRDQKGSSADFMKAIALEHKKAHSYFNLGLNELINNNDSIACHYFKIVLKLDPNYLKAKEQIKKLSL